MKIHHLPFLVPVLMLLAACLPATTAAPTDLPAQTPEPVMEPASTLAPATQTAVPSTATLPPGVLVDDFEKINTFWKPGALPTYADSSASTVKLSVKYAAHGKQSLLLTFQKDDRPKAIYFVEGQFNFNDGDYLAFELNDADGVVEAAAVAICTGKDWTWHESTPVAVQQGVNTLAYNLSAATYKTAASNWEPTTSIAERSDVKRLAVILYPKLEGSVYVDHIRLLPKGAAVTLPPSAQPVISAPVATPTPGPCPGKAAMAPSSDPLVLTVASAAPALRYGRVELELQTSFTAQNPYDPTQINLLLHVTGPNGTKFSVPAFWFQDFDPSTAAPCGQPGWRARFTPTQPGDWSVQAEIVGQNTTSQPVTIAVADAVSPGFVRLNADNNRYFAFDDGSTFFPVGLNIGWWQKAPLEDYARWMDRLSANGGTIIRVWMASWSFAIEWNDTGLGNYDRRQYQAWLLDQLFEMARQRGIYIELVLLNHGAFSDNVNPEWDSNPYNAARGGMLQYPGQFATNEDARELFKRRVRYIVSRWGYSTHLFAWEWWNEVNWTPIKDQDLAPWVVEMTAELQKYDPYDHLVSISYATTGGGQVLSLPEIDFAQYHAYTGMDPMKGFGDYFTWQRQPAGDKPVLFAEFGYNAGVENTSSFDKDGIHLHNGLWAATFSGFASPAMYWWWDLYVDPLNLWGQFGGLTTFLKGQDLATLRPLGPGKIKLSDGKNANLMALYNETHLLAWVRQAKYNAMDAEAIRDGDIRYKKTPETKWKLQLEPLTSLTLTTSALKDGAYTVSWYDPSTAQWFSESTVTVQDGTLTLDVPVLSTDLAVKIEPVK